MQLLNACLVTDERKNEVWGFQHSKINKNQMNNFIIKILNKYAYEINPEEVLKSLPKNFEIEKLNNFIKKSFFKKNYLNSTSILYQKFIEFDQEDDENLNSSRLVYSETFCNGCHKKIGKGVPIYFNYPNFDVYHVKCPKS